MSKNRSDDPAVKTTLIVAPLALLNQWKAEIEEKTGDRMTVYIYHGSNKTKNKKDLQKFDVVLTTYSVSAGLLMSFWKLRQDALDNGSRMA